MTKWRVRFYQKVKTHSLISVHIQFVSHDYDTTPIRKNQFILENSAFSLSVWYGMLKEKWDGKPVPYKAAKDGTLWNYRKENRIGYRNITTAQTVLILLPSAPKTETQSYHKS